MQAKEATLKENLYRHPRPDRPVLRRQGPVPGLARVAGRGGLPAQAADGPVHARHRLDARLRRGGPRPAERAAGGLRREERVRAPVSFRHAVQRVVRLGSSMTTTRAIRLVAALLLPALAATGCAARWAYRQGQDARRQGGLGPCGGTLHARAREGPEEHHVQDRARERARPGEPPPLRRGAQAPRGERLREGRGGARDRRNYDPANRSASDDLAIVRRRIQKQQDEQREREEFDEMKAPRPGRRAAARARALAAQRRADRAQLPRRQPAEDPRDARPHRRRERPLRRGLPRQAHRRRDSRA